MSTAAATSCVGPAPSSCALLHSSRPWCAHSAAAVGSGNGGTIWGSSTSIKAKRAGKPRKKLTGDRPGSKTGGRPKSQPEKEAAVPVPDGDFEAVAEFDGPRPGSIFKAGPNGTGYYRDAPAAGPAAGPQVHTVRPSSASGACGAQQRPGRNLGGAGAVLRLMRRARSLLRLHFPLCRLRTTEQGRATAAERGRADDRRADVQFGQHLR